MLKLIVLVHTLGVVSTLDNRYNPYPYYQPQNAENLNPIASLHHQQEAIQQDNPPLDERFGGFLPPPFHGGTFGVGLGGHHQPVAAEGGYGGSQGEYSNGPPGPISPPPYGYPDPGFQTQTGFEGLLVPNTWYGLLPWGIEGVIIVIAGIIVFAVIIIALIGLLAWLLGVKTALPLIIKSEDSTESRSSWGNPWGESFMNLTATAIDAIEKLNEVLGDSDEEIKKDH